MFRIRIDSSDLLDLNGLDKAAKKEVKKAGENLTKAGFIHIMEQAKSRLKTRKKLFVDSLSYFQVDEDTWVINLDAKAAWIDDGMEPHSMIEDLTSSKKAKFSKDGSKYLVVPFQHNKDKGQRSPAQEDLLKTIKKELKEVGQTLNKIVKDHNGNPQLGLVHSIDLMSKPTKTHEGPEQGKGPVGSVRQGPTGIPFLQGLRVYQNYKKMPDGSQKIQRSIMTFRTVSTKMDKSRWFHPGLEPTHLMEEGYKWMIDEWNNKIAPDLLEKVINAI